MKLSLRNDNGRWMCHAPHLADELLKTRRPDSSLVKALETFHSRYYPDESATDPRNPWILHRDYGPREVAKRVTQHELTWHWRLLLPFVKDPTQDAGDGTSLVLCVSQVRQWQLVSCFRMKWPSPKTSFLPQAVRAAPKALLRPPVFGRSHRVTRSEVYAVLYEPKVLTEVRTAVKNAGDDEFRLAHVVGRHDTYFRIVDAALTKGNSYELDIHHVIDLEPEQAPLILDGTKAREACRPYGLAYLPAFCQGPKDDPPPVQPLLLSSDNYCRALEQVSDVVNDPSARTVLVIAPPGSGKEGLSAALHRCRPTNGGDLIVTNLAGLDETKAADLLFHLDREDLNARLDESKHRLAPGFQSNVMDGAFFKALRGTLVIDELDKTTDGVRSMLLRVLESDEISIPGTSVTVKILGAHKPLIVFVGSKTRKEFLQLGPIDFWSRITHLVEMQHPLSLGEIVDRTRVAEDYVRLFWLQHVNDSFRDRGFLKRSEEFYEPVRRIYVRWWRFFVDRAVGEFVASEVASILCAPGQPLPSVRTLRATVARCFGLLFHALLYHKQSHAPLEVWRSEKSEDQSARMLKLLRKIRRSSHGPGTLSLTDVGAVSELRDLIRVSLSVQV